MKNPIFTNNPKIYTTPSSRPKSDTSHFLLRPCATAFWVSAFGSCQEGLRFYSRLGCQNQRSCLSNEIISWRVDSHHFWLAPTAWGPSPPPGMALTGLFIDVSMMATDNVADFRAELRSRRFGLAQISPWSPGPLCLNQATVPLSLKLKLTMLSSKSWSPPPFRSSRPITPDPNTRNWLSPSLLAERKEKKVSPVWATVA